MSSEIAIETVKTKEMKRIFQEVKRVRRRDGAPLTYEDVRVINDIAAEKYSTHQYIIRGYGGDKIYTLKATGEDMWDMEGYLQDRLKSPEQFMDFTYIEVTILKPK